MNDLLAQAQNLLISTPTIILIPFAAYGFVLIVGRGLNILKNDIGKNIFAFILILGFTVLKDYLLPDFTFGYIIIDWFIQGGLSFALYTLFIWRLFSRVDNWLDKKGLDDKKRRG